MATKPEIISSQQPHTVSLPAGSTVAARKAPRKPPAGPDVLDMEMPKPRARPAPAPAAPKVGPKTAAKPASKAAPRKAAPAPAPAPQVEQVGFGADIMQRLAGLRQRNDQVRAALDQLPDASGAKR